MKRFVRTHMERNRAFVQSNNRRDFHSGYRNLYRLGFRRVNSFYVNLGVYKEFWVKMVK